MKYVYKNLKHVTLHGIEPFGVKEFDHQILGGGIELVETKTDELKRTIKKTKKNYGDE